MEEFLGGKSEIGSGIIGARYSGELGDSRGGSVEVLGERVSVSLWTYPGVLIDARADVGFCVYRFGGELAGIYRSWRPSGIEGAQLLVCVSESGWAYVGTSHEGGMIRSLWGRSEYSVWRPIAGKERSDGTIVMVVPGECSGSLGVSLVGNGVGVAFRRALVIDDSGEVTRVLDVRPGSRKEIAGLLPGSYTVHAGLGSLREITDSPQATQSVEVRCGQVTESSLLLPTPPRPDKYVYGQVVYSQLTLLDGVVDRGRISYGMTPLDTALRAHGTDGWAKLAGVTELVGEGVDPCILGPLPDGDYEFEVHPLNARRTVHVAGSDLDLGEIAVDIARVVVDVSGSQAKSLGIKNVSVMWVDGDGGMRSAPTARGKDGSWSAVCPPGQIHAKAQMNDGRVFEQEFGVVSGLNAVSIARRDQSIYTLRFEIDGAPIQRTLDWWFAIRVTGGGDSGRYLHMAPREFVADINARYEEVLLYFDGAGSFDVAVPAVEGATKAFAKTLVVEPGVIADAVWEL